jgi:hypothetical protein
MQQQSVVMVIVLTIITFGIYGIVWMVKTKDQMNALGANIPTGWWLIVPIGNIWWMWKYSQGVEIVTRNKMGAAVAFILLAILGLIGMAIIQAQFNGMSQQPA